MYTSLHNSHLLRDLQVWSISMISFSTHSFYLNQSAFMLGPLSNNMQNKKALSGHCQQLAATQAVWAAEIWQQSPNACTKDLSKHWMLTATFDKGPSPLGNASPARCLWGCYPILLLTIWQKAYWIIKLTALQQHTCALPFPRNAVQCYYLPVIWGIHTPLIRMGHSEERWGSHRW